MLAFRHSDLRDETQGSGQVEALIFQVEATFEMYPTPPPPPRGLRPAIVRLLGWSRPPVPIDDGPREFTHTSMDEEESPLIAFRLAGQGFRLESHWQEYPETIVFPPDEVRSFRSKGSQTQIRPA